MRKTITLGFVLTTLLASNLLAIGEARFTGKVVDAQGNPLDGVAVTISATRDKNFTQNAKSDKKGNVAIFVIDGTIPYKFIFAKEGYQTYEEVIKLKLVPEKNAKTVQLQKAGQATTAAGAPAGATEMKADPAVTAYNEGVALANSGNTAESILKLEEAVTLKPDLIAGYLALTKLYARAQNWEKVVDRGTKVLEITPDDTDTLSIMAEAYDKLGNKVKAGEFRKKAPANPTTLFNDAARLINAQNDKAAEPLLKQALELDPAFSVAYYELGMIQARSGRNADARANLQKYIELDPKGRDIETAKEMLKYIK